MATNLKPFQPTARGFRTAVLDQLNDLKHSISSQQAFFIVEMDESRIQIDLVQDFGASLLQRSEVPHPLYKKGDQLVKQLEYFKKYPQQLEPSRQQLWLTLKHAIKKMLSARSFCQSIQPMICLACPAAQAQILLGKDLELLGQAGRKLQIFKHPKVEKIKITNQNWSVFCLPQGSSFFSSQQMLKLLSDDRLQDEHLILSMDSSIELFWVKQGIIYSSSSLWTPLEDHLKVEQNIYSYIDDWQLDRKILLSKVKKEKRLSHSFHSLQAKDRFLVFRQAQAALKVALEFLLQAANCSATEVKSIYLLSSFTPSPSAAEWLKSQLLPSIAQDQIYFQKTQSLNQAVKRWMTEDNRLNLDWPMAYLELSSQPHYYKKLVKAMQFK